MELDQRLAPTAGPDLPIGDDRVARSSRPSAIRPVNSPSSIAGPTRVTMRALQRECPSLSSQQSTVAPGS